MVYPCECGSELVCDGTPIQTTPSPSTPSTQTNSTAVATNPQPSSNSTATAKPTNPSATEDEDTNVVINVEISSASTLLFTLSLEGIAAISLLLFSLL